MCFEPGEHQLSGGTVVEQVIDCFDPRMMAEAIEEMSFDVDHWLLLAPAPRAPEAQALLKLVDHWVLLSTCDHDGVVAGYRTLKGLADLHRPRLSLAVLDAPDAAVAEKVYRKLAGVCEQFLDRALDPEPPVARTAGVCEHLAMLCRPNRDKAQLANPPQWGVVEAFLNRAKARQGRRSGPAGGCPGARGRDCGAAAASSVQRPVERETVGEVVVPVIETPAAERAEATVAEVNMSDPVQGPVAVPCQPPRVGDDALAEVLDLPSADASAEQIVSAVLKQDGSAMLECPVRPPMCADARLAVTRDRRVVLLAVAKRGLTELNTIGQAYRWLIENRSLIGMAVPQLAIDAAQAPRLRLLVDQSDAGAEALQPMLTGDHVAVQSYRRVRWGGRAGLLLEAA
jgi:hypothetical protein